MIEVRTTHGGSHRGRSPQTIARRLYGKNATIRFGSMANLGIDGYVEVTVTTPVPGQINVSNVRASWLLDQAALDAAAAEGD